MHIWATGKFWNLQACKLHDKIRVQEKPSKVLLPIGSILVPFWPYQDPKYEPQKGTTVEPMGIVGFRQEPGNSLGILSLAALSARPHQSRDLRARTPLGEPNVIRKTVGKSSESRIFMSSQAQKSLHFPLYKRAILSQRVLKCPKSVAKLGEP